MKLCVMMNQSTHTYNQCFNNSAFSPESDDQRWVRYSRKIMLIVANYVLWIVMRLLY